jgi:hypothetical protein
MVTSAVLRLGEVRWEFRPVKDGVGLSVRWEQGGQRGDFVLKDGLLAGELAGIATSGKLYSADSQGLVLGVAIRRPGTQSIVYGMVWCGGEVAKMRQASTWTTSEALFTAPIDKPFHTLTIAMPEGDTVLFTIQRLDRKWPAGENAIETHSFINNATIRGLTSDTTWHYSAVLQKQPDAKPAPAPVAPARKP